MDTAIAKNPNKKLDIDLYIIILSSFIIIGLYSIFQSKFITFVKNQNMPLLVRTIVSALLQFGVAGLGITIVSFLRKESFISYGLRRKGTLLSIFFSFLCFIPYIVFLFITKQIDGYLPFQSVWVMKEVLESSFPFNIIGIIPIVTAWGFFEGFNYVVISEKLNQKYPSKYKWLNWGAIICAILCILIHGIIGVTLQNFIEMITILIIIYGMLMVKEFTKNAWGCVFVFIFLWNAF
jgi:hypothetical protein